MRADQLRRPPGEEPAAPVAAPRAAAARQVLQMQRAHGNAAVARMLQREEIKGEPSNAEPGDKPGTVSAMPTMQDTQGPLDETDRTPVEPLDLHPGKQLKIKATAASPVVRHESGFPGFPEMWDSKELPANTPPIEGYEPVYRIEQPAPELKMTDDLFIGDGPKALDVQQGMLGDCWDLAVVQAIVSRDPKKISSIITPSANGNGVTATFLRRKTEWTLSGRKYTYEPVSVTTSGELQFQVDKAGRNSTTVNGERKIYGSQLRHGATAVDKRWWVDVIAGDAVVKSTATYQCARWAPLLEKAFAMFAAKYGQYGGASGALEPEQSGGKGASAIDGGQSSHLYSVFYGEQGDITQHPENVPVAATAYSPGVNNLVNNVAVIKQLLPLQNASDQAGPDGTGNVPLVTAAAFSQPMYTRLGQAIDLLQSFEEYKTKLSEDTRRNVSFLRDALRERGDSRPLLDSSDDKSTADIARFARNVFERGGSDLRALAGADDRMATTAQDVRDLTLDVMNSGTDKAPMRNLQGEHAYTVVSSKFADDKGEQVTLPPTLPTDQAELMHVLASVSEAKSTVRIRNPHHKDEPDEQANGEASRPDSDRDDGLFNMSVHQFMVNFADVSSFSAPHS